MTEAERQIVLVFKDCFSTESGKKVLEYLSNYCFEKRDICVNLGIGDGLNNMAIQNVRNGMRRVILEIRRLVEKNLDKPEPEPAIKEQNYI